MQNSNIKLIFLAILLTVLPATSTLAGTLSAIINGKSYHINSTYDWNEDNYGLGLEYGFDTRSRWKKTVMVNGFRDSSDAMSYMAGAGLHRRLLATERFANFYVDAGVTAFVMTREDVNDNRPFPGALPSLSLGNRYAGFNMTYLPRQAVQEMVDAQIDDPTINGILFVQFKVSIGEIFARD